MPNVSTDVSFGLQTGAHLTARRTDASCISLDTVLISPSIEAGPLPGARIAGRVPGRLAWPLGQLAVAAHPCPMPSACASDCFRGDARFPAGWGKLPT